MLLRGHIGRAGAGPCPIRGPQQVQGNRTAGSTTVPARRSSTTSGKVCEFEPPREHGLGTVATIEAMHKGDVTVFVAIGGNFALATHDLPYTAEALRKVQS